MQSAALTTAIVLLTWASPTSASPIEVITGSLVGDDYGATVTLETSAFWLEGRGFGLTGAWGPGCKGQCYPGQEYGLDTGFVGLDFSGRAVIDGVAYPLGSARDEAANAAVFFTGFWLAPERTPSDRAVVIRPFTLTGTFSYPLIWPPGTPTLAFYGSGIARLNLVWDSFEGGWSTESARYQITHQPVPERGTVVLMMAGLVALACHRLRA